MDDVHSSVFAAVGSSVGFKEPMRVEEDTACNELWLTAVVAYVAGKSERLEVRGASKQRQTGVIVAFAHAGLAPSHDL